MTALEELQEEVVGALYTLTRDNLLEISDFLNISGDQRADVKGKSRISLVTHILKHLEREEVADLEDDGMSEFLSLKDKTRKALGECRPPPCERTAICAFVL